MGILKMKNIFKFCFAGAGLGFLIGIIVGLTTEGLAATLLTTLTAILAGYFGLSRQVSDGNSNHQKEFLVGCFGICCGLSLLLGIHLRVNDTLGMEASERITYWRQLGFSEAEIKKAISFQILGIDLTNDKPTDSSSRDVGKGSITGLFSDTEDLCTAFNSEDDIELKLELLVRNAYLKESIKLMSSHNEADINNATNSLMILVCERYKD